MYLPKGTHLFFTLAYIATHVFSAPSAGSSLCPSELKPNYSAPALAPGYRAQLIAKNLTKPRGLVFDKDGTLLVIEQQAGITSLTVEGDDCLTVTQRTDVMRNTKLTHGITLSSDGNTLYASSATRVYSWPYDAIKNTASGDGREVINVTNFGNGNHITRTLLYSQKQENTLIVSRGSESNIDFSSLDLSTGHCQIKSFAVQNDDYPIINFNTSGKLLGWGLRNAVGLAEHPITGGLYSVEMGMDVATRDGKDISENNPGDELNYHGILGRQNDLDQGLNHGYPYCQSAWDVEAIPNHSTLVTGDQFLLGDVNNTYTGNDTMNDAVCARERAAPVIVIPPHNAPIDIKFNADGSEAYVSLHGSWDRNGSVGYKVAKINFADGKPVAPKTSKTAVIDVMSNPDLSKCGQIVPYVWNKDCFRPAGLAFDKAGRLYMSSDETGEIWVITKTSNNTATQ